MTSRTRIFHAATVLLFGATALLPRPALPAGDDTPGVTALLGACQACHGGDGISEGGDVPNLAGQKPNYLVRQLEAFRSGERKSAVMAAIAGQLADADIRALALHWSQLPGARPSDGKAPAPTAIRSRMVFPAGFPEGFAVYETTVAAPDGSFIKRYANETALRALRTGQALAHGASIIVANHGSARDVTSYAAMESRAGWGAELPRLLRNGDWDYALFGADRVRRDTLNQAPCLACHKPLAGDSFVFTMKALREHATQRAPGAR
jgi:cytochrome c553